MDHLAILDKKRKLLDKIISGEKTIESRWYKFKRDPWNKIKKGDYVYFKESGEPVTVKAEVEKVLFFDLEHKDKNEIMTEFGERIGHKDPKNYKFPKDYDKRYCILVFLKNIKKIDPFSIDKRGYGLMSAWICVDNIDKIKLP